MSINMNKQKVASLSGATQVVSAEKNPPAKAGDKGCILGQEDPLEKGMTTHCSVLAWRIPWSEEPDRLQSIGSKKIGYDSACMDNISLLWKNHSAVKVNDISYSVDGP